MKLTQSGIAKLALPKTRDDAIFFDDELPRFGVRLREGGSRKYVVQYRQGGIKRRYTIGPATTLTLEEARKRARKVLVAVDDGRDPATEKEVKRAAAALIFAGVMQDYLRVCETRMRPRTFVGATYQLTKQWKPLHKLPLGAVSRSIIAAHMRIIAKENGPVSANRARSTLSAMFAWAIGEGLCESNPVIGTNKATDERQRERVLSDAEMAAIWNAAPDNAYGRIVKLLMLTGQRREEIGALRWSEIDTEAKLITLPTARTKNGQEHQVPLSGEAIAILEGCFRHRDLVFSGAKGFAGWSKGKAALDSASGVKDWTVHDLRRTCATRMADLGIQPHIIEAILNHVSGHKSGVAGVYNRSTYASEKRAALDAWASHLKVLLAQASGANVVTLAACK
jgi:integrase